MARNQNEFQKLIDIIKPLFETIEKSHGSHHFVYFEDHRKLTIEIKHVVSMREGKINSIVFKLHKGELILIRSHSNGEEQELLLKTSGAVQYKTDFRKDSESIEIKHVAGVIKEILMDFVTSAISVSKRVDLTKYTQSTFPIG